jgi:anti-sigma factor RsiW
MSCELYQSEMYAWRPGCDAADFQPLFDHLAKCPACKRLFEQLTATDQSIQRTLQKLPPDHALESRILAGLAHQRVQATTRRTAWKRWLLVPLAASIVFVVALGVRPRLQEIRLHREITTLLSQPPEVQISSTDRQQLLSWSGKVVAGLSQLPPELNKVEFRGATSLNVENHKAVLFKMKNERRASLLVVDGQLAQTAGFKALRAQSGSASLWSDGRRTYVLLYEGSVEEMHAYMTLMGIGA